MTVRIPASDSDLSLSERELFERLGWFIVVRWGAGFLALAFLALGWFVFRVRFDALPAAGTIFVLFAYNAVFFFWVRWLYRHGPIRGRIIRALAHTQMICDLLAVAALVHFIGGVENHFIVLFLFPMIVASEFFRPSVAYAYATGAVVLVNFIGWGEYFGLLPPRPLLLGGAPLVTAGRRWMLDLQVCVVMTFALYATVFVAASIAARLRSREEELENAHRGLQSLDQLKSQFMLKASHELRSPIGTVQSLLQVAISLPPGDPKIRELLERAAGRCNGMGDLIGDLLMYSRLRTVAPPASFEIFDLAELAGASIDLFRAQALAKDLQLDADVHSVRVRGDRHSLSDLINNLLSNAIRYTPPCGRVSVLLACEGGRGTLSVADTGIGIPGDELPHIFDEFYRGREARRQVPHGTGLGMSIVRGVLDMHDWEIRTESAPGQGTRFQILMPCVQLDTAGGRQQET